MTTNRTNEQPMPGMDAYRESIDQLHFSDEAKARMAARLAEAATKEQPMSTTVTPLPARRRRLPLAAVAAGIALALCVGGVAYAAGGLVSITQFVNHLFGNDAKVEVVDKIGRPVGVAQSVNGVTVSADAIIGDQSTVAVVFSIAKDDGTPFEGIETLDNGLLAVGFAEELDIDLPLITKVTQGLGATGSSYFYDADPADNAIQLVETRSYEGGGDGFSLVGRTMTARFADLRNFSETYDDAPIIAPGSWTLSFPLDYEDATIALPAGQGFRLDGFREDDATGTREQVGPIDATIDELSISPMALHVSYTTNQEVSWTSGESGQLSEHDSQLSDTLLTVPASLTLRDGSVIELSSNAGGSISADAEVAHCETSIFFDRILDLDEVASVTIGGTTIAL